MVLLLQGQSDPLMSGQRKANLNVKALWTYLKLEQGAFMKLSAGSKSAHKVTCAEQEVMIGSSVADPVGLEVTTGTSIVSACSSCTSVRVFEVSVAPVSASRTMTLCCAGLLVSRMSSAASWK